MYDDSWYSYVPESKKEDGSHSSKHRRRESMLKQPNGHNQVPDPVGPLMEIFHEDSGLKGPPQATLARRAKSYSDFYEVAVGYLGKDAKEQPMDALEVFEHGESHIPFAVRYGQYENDILDASQDEYQLYRDQLALSERHLDSLLDNTTSALDLLATLSESFKAVESQTTAFQAQCEDLLAEQKRLRDLADEIGTDLQYYAYLEPLIRRLNAPGAGRLVRSDDFLDMLTNLNTCIDFMDKHPDYRDSTLYKTRYISLLQRCLTMVQTAFTIALKAVTDDALEQLKSKNPNQTLRHILLNGKFEDFFDDLGPVIQHLLRNEKVAIPGSVVQYYETLSNELTQAYLRSRESLVSPEVLKDLRQTELVAKPGAPESDFQLFARRCVLNVFEFCLNEYTLVERFFYHDRTVWSERSDMVKWDTISRNAETMEQMRLSYINSLHAVLTPYLTKGDLDRICNLINWLETTYLGASETEEEHLHRRSAQFYLDKHLWPLCDSLFINTARELERFKPSLNDLKLGGAKSNASQNVGNDIEISHPDQMTAPSVSTAYPTVKTAVRLLILYNESSHERPKGDVIYEIVDQATDSLRIAATAVKNNSGLLHAQIFLIKNLMLIRNLFLTHEIPESIRRSAELDFSPIWATIGELQARKQLFNPLAYINPLVRGQLLPAVVDKVLDARKKLENLLAQQITEFTKYWRSRLTEQGQRNDALLKAHRELEDLLDMAALEESMKEGLWRIIQDEEL